MLRIGVTGGIGSGKSVICRIFEVLGAPVFNADKEAGVLMENDPVVRNAIKREFGSNIYTTEGLDRKRLAAIVFSNPELLDKINGIVHPAVAMRFVKWASEMTVYPYLVKESAILFETGTYRELDHVILVTAPVEQRINRVMQRDGVDRESVERRMINQWPDGEKSRLAGTVLLNDGNNPVLPVILDLDKRFRSGNYR